MQVGGIPHSEGLPDDVNLPGIVKVANGILTNVHSLASCAGQYCWVHRPSRHHMITWPVAWRNDIRTAERLCTHGVGHPDPDDVAYNRSLGRDTAVHSCDGCCSPTGTTFQRMPLVSAVITDGTDSDISLTSLMDCVSGAYTVITESSCYLIDLDRNFVSRHPRATDPRVSILRRDERPVKLVDIVECTLGRSMALRIDLNLPGVAFTTRLSTPVEAIQLVRPPV